VPFISRAKKCISARKRGAARPLPYEEIVSFSRQILQGLDHLHRHGVAVRDLKPANILLNPKDDRNIDATAHLVLCDFSLATNMCSKIGKGGSFTFL
jgi:serine/threonine protein kinase